MRELKRIFCSMLLGISLAGGLTTVLAPTPAQAQTVSGEITGSVTDPTGAAIANAQVVAAHVVTGITTTALTNSSGLYNFSELPAGTYDVTVTSSGFSTSVLKALWSNLTIPNPPISY
jgi:Carboxypeptidase regulatory-like domain